MSYISGPGKLGIKVTNAECGLPEQQPVRIDQVSGNNNYLEFYDIAGNLVSWIDATGTGQGNLFGGGGSNVTLAPATSIRNIIQPSADVIPLTIKGFAGQTAHLLEFQDSAGAILSFVNAAGAFNGPVIGNVTGNLTGNVTGSVTGTASGNVALAPGSDGRNLITPTGDFRALSIQAPAAYTKSFFEAIENSGNVAFLVGASGQPVVTKLDALTISTTDVLSLRHNSTGTPAGGFGSRAMWRLASDTTINREAFDTTVIWATATDASRKARTVFNVWDTAAREAIRMEASGAAPLLGFFGVPAVAQIAGNSDILAGMVSLGFRAASSNPPLNMGTGALTAGAAAFTSITVPGAGTLSERYGASAAAAGSNGTAVGNSASAPLADGTAIGKSALSGTTGVAVGSGAVTVGLSGVAIGQGAATGAQRSIAIGSGANAQAGSSISIGFVSTSNVVNTCVIGGPTAQTSFITDFFLGSGIVDTAPTSTVIHATGGSGTNIAGASITIAGGRSTGSAAGGDIVFQASVAGSSGAGVNALQERARISAATSTLTVSRMTTVQDRTVADFAPSFVVATDASRTGRLVFNIYDTAAREAMRFEASGTAAMIGFLGAAAVVRQANASQAAITAVLDANAKSALQAIYNLLLAYGLAPATA